MRARERSKDDDVEECVTWWREERQDVGYVFGGGNRGVQGSGVEWEDCAVGRWVAGIEGVVGDAC